MRELEVGFRRARTSREAKPASALLLPIKYLFCKPELGGFRRSFPLSLRPSSTPIVTVLPSIPPKRLRRLPECEVPSLGAVHPAPSAPGADDQGSDQQAKWRGRVSKPKGLRTERRSIRRTSHRSAKTNSPEGANLPLANFCAASRIQRKTLETKSKSANLRGLKGASFRLANREFGGRNGDPKWRTAHRQMQATERPSACACASQWAPVLPSICRVSSFSSLAAPRRLCSFGADA